MKRMKYLILLIFFCIYFDAACQASEMAKVFLSGIQSYNENDFPKAIEAFRKVADSGIKNSKLYYNIGNAYLRNNDLGNAILWYERAMKLNPNDPDLKFNHEYAMSLTKDEKSEKEPIIRILFFWKYLFDKESMLWAAIIFNFLFWTIVSVQAIRRNRKWQWRTLQHLLLILSMICVFTTGYNYYETHYMMYGIILPAKISVRSGLTDDSTELFVLHAGTKVKIDRKKEDSIRIFFSEGKIGWVKAADVGEI